MQIRQVRIKIPIPAMAGRCGKLMVYQTHIPPSQIIELLRHDPRNWDDIKDENIKSIYKAVQRKTTSERREAVAKYIQDRMTSTAQVTGAFPAICIGMTDQQTFNGDENGLGILKLDLSHGNGCILLDGLGRVSGAMQLLDAGIDVDAMLTLPVTIFVPAEGKLTVTEIGQLFRDFNYLGVPVPARHAISLDHSDPYLKLTNDLAKTSVIVRHGKMEKRAMSIGKRSTALVAQQQLMRFVRGACEGRKFQEANLASIDTPNLTNETYASMLANLENYLEEIATRMGDRFSQKGSLLLAAPGWQVLGLIFYDFEYRLAASRATPKLYSEILDAIANVDWSRHNPDWIGLLGEAELDKRTGVPIVDAEGRQRIALSKAGRTTIAKLYQYLRVRTGLDKLLDVPTSAAA